MYIFDSQNKKTEKKSHNKRPNFFEKKNVFLEYIEL